MVTKISDMPLSMLRKQLGLAWQHFGECLKALNGEDSEPCELEAIADGDDSCDDLELYYACKRVGEHRLMGVDIGDIGGDGSIVAETAEGCQDMWIRNLSDGEMRKVLDMIKSFRSGSTFSSGVPTSRFIKGDTVYFCFRNADGNFKVCRDVVVDLRYVGGGYVYDTDIYSSLPESDLFATFAGLAGYLEEEYGK